MAKQEQFRNTFFELLRMLQTIVEELKLNVKEVYGSSFTFTGKGVFEELFRERKTQANSVY